MIEKIKDRLEYIRYIEGDIDEEIKDSNNESMKHYLLGRKNMLDVVLMELGDILYETDKNE